MAEPWNYQAGRRESVELCTVRGHDVALPVHFHAEAQLTFVRAGRRRFVIGDRPVTVAAGQCVLIPAYVPHSSQADPAGVDCVNAYLPDGSYEDHSNPATGLREVVRRHRSVAEAAAVAGMSREGFSRAFAARFGIPPGAYRRILQLNEARRMLRAGETIAAAAAQSGFADQSHLGRWFRRTFGVTPGRYRRGMVKC